MGKDIEEGCGSVFHKGTINQFAKNVKLALDSAKQRL